MRSPCVKRGRPKGENLTPTDFAVLREIAKQGFQTYPELRAEHLKEKSRGHSWAVMRRLVRLGILNECIGDGGGIRGWALSTNGQKKFQEQLDTTRLTRVRPPRYRTSFDHDVVLRDVRRLLCNSPAVTEWTPEHILRAETMSEIGHLGSRDQREIMRAVPDATFILRHGSKN